MKHFLILLLVSFPALANDSKQVIATISGQKVTRGEIENSLAEIAEMVDGGKPKLETFPKDFQKEFIDKYIDKLLLVAEGRKQGVHKTQEVKDKVRVVEDFLTQQKYLKDIVAKQNNDKKLKEIYNEKFANQEDEIEVQASHILVKTEEKAKELKKEIDNGADFEKLAKENSIEPGAKVSGGELGYFVKADMVPEFSDAVFKLKKNQVSEPIKTSFGWHVAKVTDTRKKEKMTFKKAKPALEAELARRVIEKKVKALRAKKEIEYKIDLGLKKAAPKPEIKKLESK